MTAHSSALSVKLDAGDPRWERQPKPWGVSMWGSKRHIHRITYTADVGTGFYPIIHAQTACGSYLTRTALYADPVDAGRSLDECDDCLMGDTVYHVVYVFRRRGGRALYVGYTADLISRIASHKRVSRWWSPDLELTYTTHSGEDEALQVEALTITELQPVHNVREQSGRTRKASSAVTLRVNCGALIQLVADGLGVPVDCLSDKQCAAYLGIAASTFSRMRADPDHAVSAGLVARVMAICGTTTLPEGLFYPASAGEPLRLAVAA